MPHSWPRQWENTTSPSRDSCPSWSEASDGILTKVADARHKAADVYLIQLPEQYQQLARELTLAEEAKFMPSGLFSGPSATLQPLSTKPSNAAATPPPRAEIVRTTGISRTAVDKSPCRMEALA